MCGCREDGGRVTTSFKEVAIWIAQARRRKVLSSSEMVRGICDLSASTHKRQMMNAMGETNADNVTVSPLYGGSFNYTTNNDYVTHFAAKFSRSVLTEGAVRLLLSIASSNYTYSTYLEIEETDTPLTMLKRLWAVAQAELRATPGEGQVAARVSMTSALLWLVEPVDSSDVAEYNGQHYCAQHVGGAFYRVNTSATEGKWLHSTQVNPSTVVAYQSEYYAAELMVPIYHNSIPFSEVSFKMPEWLAREQYQTVLIDGAPRFITLERPMSAYLKAPIHGYSTRIESIVPAEALFQKGKTDLYAKRPNDETPFLGWELEACTNESSVDKKAIAKEFKSRLPFLVMAKSDSSIAPDGFETVSVPATLDFWKETALADTLDSMRAAPYKMRSFKHSSCGFHVHVSRSALSLLDLQKMERFMHNPANRSALEQVAGRKANTYQNYVDDLFNNRKSLASRSGSFDSSPSTHSVDGIGYFVASTPGGMTEVLRQITVAEVRNRYRGYGNSTMFSLLYTYFGDCVSYSHLNRVSGGLFNNVYSGEGDASVFSPSQAACIIALCNASPFFRWKFAEFFTSLDDRLPSITYSPAPSPAAAPTNILTGYARTKLPLGRKNSYRAAMASKFATGKGMQRYDVLNTKNENTVEFRLFKGTMNPVTVFRYFEFVDALVRYVATAPANDEGASFERFIAWVMNDAFNVSRYENLVAFFVETKMYKRESIKRRFLPEAKPEDGDLNVTPSPKPQQEATDAATPLYSLNTLDATAATAAVEAAVNSIDIDFDDEDYDEPEEDYDSECNCEDCQCARGEI